MLRIRVYAPPLGDHSPIDDEGFVELPEASTLNQLFKLLRIPLRQGAVLFCMVNYERSRLSRVLSDGDTVSFISLLAGG